MVSWRKMKMSPFVKSLIPAALLSVLVLIVFRTLQYYGPESAVWQLHEAIKSGDQALLNDSIIPPASERDDEELETVYRNVNALLSLGARFRILDKDREPSEVTVSVYYYAPNHDRFVNAPFVARRTLSGWKVDIHETIKDWNKMFRPGATDQG